MPKAKLIVHYGTYEQGETVYGATADTLVEAGVAIPVAPAIAGPVKTAKASMKMAKDAAPENKSLNQE